MPTSTNHKLTVCDVRTVNEINVVPYIATRNKAKKLLNIHPSKIRSIDVTYTSRPPTATKTFSKRGTGKQKSINRVKLYTDAIVTVCCADGVNHMKPILYTYA